MLLGLNWYGNDYKMPVGGGSIVGHQYLDLLRKHQPSLFWDKKAKEHVFGYSVDHEAHKVYYPTQQSIQRRLDLAQKHDLGISIWELGQGLDHFYDLL